MQRRLPPVGEREPPPPPNSAHGREVVERFTRAFEIQDVGAVVALLTDDVWLAMPPVPLEYQGPELGGRLLQAVTIRHGSRPRLVATRANGQRVLPHFGLSRTSPA